MTQNRSIQVIQNDCKLTTVSVPPFILGLNVEWITIISSSMRSFASSRFTPYPETSAWIKISNCYVIRLNSLEWLIMLNIYVRRDVVETPLLSSFFDCLPIFLAIPLYRCVPKAERSFKSGLFFLAICACSIVHPNSLEMRLFADFLKCC